MPDLDEVKPIETYQELELAGKIFLVHRDKHGVIVDREELDGLYMLRLLESVLKANIDHLMLAEVLNKSE